MKTRNIVIASLTAALLVGAAAPASFAAPGRGKDGPRNHGMVKEMTFVRLLKTADADKDGKITKAEVTARQEALFAEIDADKDGSLTPGELRSFRKAKVDEFRKDNPRPDRAERRKERQERREQTAENGERGERDGRRHEGRRHGMHHGQRMGGFHLIRQADTDENGQFSKAEVTAAVDRLFSRMDTDGDGVITIDDMPNRPF